MNLIFYQVKKAKKKIQFFASFKKLKKHGFNFFCKLKQAQNYLIHLFASLKKLKKKKNLICCKA